MSCPQDRTTYTLARMAPSVGGVTPSPHRPSLKPIKVELMSNDYE